MSKDFLMIQQNEPSKAVIEIDGTIGGFDWEEFNSINTGRDIRKQLHDIEALEVSEIEVKITSLGGSVNEALQIHDALKAHPAKITTIVEGFCASAATIIALAGDVRKISANALYLIHKCNSTVENANENDLLAELDDQRTINGVIFDLYKQVNKKSEDDLRALFEANNGAGKWITADEALQFGFATEITTFEKQTVTNIARFFNNARLLLTDFNNENKNDMIPFESKFPAISNAIKLNVDFMFEEEKGVQISNDSLERIENALTTRDNIKNEFVKLTEELQKAKEALTVAENKIETLTNERDNYKAKFEARPAITLEVKGEDNATGSFSSYVENDEYYKHITNILNK